MKLYGSKTEIYEDFAIAIKFVPAGNAYLDSGDYERLYELLRDDCRCRIEKVLEYVDNFPEQYPQARIGCFLEMVVRGYAGEAIGTRFVLLEHETGWELFVADVLDSADLWGPFLGAKAGDVIFDTIAESALNRLIELVKSGWRQRGGVRISYVEIRTKEKGVARLPFSEFTTGQLRCLVERFDRITTLKQANDACFGRRLTFGGLQVLDKYQG